MKKEETTTMTAVQDGKPRRNLEVQMELVVRSILKVEIPDHLLPWRKMIRKDLALDLIPKLRKIESDPSLERKAELGVEVEGQEAEVEAGGRKSFEDRGVNQ